jgi:hypothetical protein
MFTDLAAPNISAENLFVVGLINEVVVVLSFSSRPSHQEPSGFPHTELSQVLFYHRNLALSFATYFWVALLRFHLLEGVLTLLY